MEQPEITFDKLPEAVAALSEQVGHIRKLLEKLQPSTAYEPKPIGIDEACKLIMKAKPTVYAMVQKKQIPCYKSGRKLYFYRQELLDWIAGGKQKSLAETKEDIRTRMEGNVKNKPKRRMF